MSTSNIQTVRGVKLFTKKHKSLQKLLANPDSPEIHGDKVWFSSYFIMDYLAAKPPAPKNRIMEVGSGWGLLSIFCAQNYDAKVKALDADKNVFPFLELHA